jgi:hypothetical protein
MFPHLENERSSPPHPKSPSTAATKSTSTSATEESGKSPSPSTTNKGLASGDGVDVGADAKPDHQDDDDNSGSNEDSNEDSNENDDKDIDEDEDDNNSDDGSREHNPRGQSYHDRHPGVPVQPPKRLRAGKGKSTAEQNMAVLRGKELKAARKILNEKVREFKDLLKARGAELSEQLNILLCEVKQRLGHITRYTDGRNHNEFSAKV